ncbi:unnamed protein product [Rotaria sp. Silwood1]|nr:unnamed protein product [Rotaria sp. Silwood1]
MCTSKSEKLLCSQNPNSTRRRPLNRHSTTPGRRRRAVSDSVSPIPTAPHRTRSPSLTEDDEVPKELQCPITGALFRDPVVASDGHTYEREAIIRWLQRERISPITREPMSIDKLNPNRILDADIKKTEKVPFIKTATKAFYRAEWLNKTSSSNDSHIVLIHLTGENAEKIAEINCRMGAHPNIDRVLGRVEHKDTGILLVQENLSEKTLSQLMQNSHQTLSINIIDIILYQIASALQYLSEVNIIHGNVTSNNVFIYYLDDVPENTLIKLTNIGDTESEASSNEIHPEKSDIYAFGKLAREMYLLLSEKNNQYLKEREILFQRCLSLYQNERPTFNELTEAISKFVHEDESILKSKSPS